MSYRVLKFPLVPAHGYHPHLGDEVELEMPANARILSLQAQLSVPTIWVLVDAEMKRTEKRRFRFFGTGPAITGVVPEAYIGTVLLLGGELVLHVFEAPK